MTLTRELPTPAQVVRDPGIVLRLERSEPRLAERLWQSLSPQQRLRAVLNTPEARDRERLILMARDSQWLTRALAPEEFAYTVLELGPEDAGELLALSSDEQLSFLLDLTGWVRERFAPTRYEVWLPLLLEAGAERLKRWMASTDLEVLALLVAHWVRVVKFLPSQDQQEPPDDLPEFTLDGVYYIDFRNPTTKDFVVQVLVLMKSEMPRLYEEVMETMLWESAIEMAEQARRWRAGRMADLGFPDRLEALELWARPMPGELEWHKLPTKVEIGFQEGAPPRSGRCIEMLPGQLTLPAVVGRLNPWEVERIKAELVYVANCGVVALDADPAEPEQVRRAGQEALGLVNVGLEALSKGEMSTAGEIVRRVGLAALARRGAAEIRKLNRRAWALVREGWLKAIPTGVHILGTPMAQWVAGLMFPRPRCYDPQLPPGMDYRAFLSMSDVNQARRWLELAQVWGEILEMMGASPQDVAALIKEAVWPEEAEDITLVHVTGTLLARRYMGLEGLGPIPRARLNQAVEALKQAISSGELVAQIKTSVEALDDRYKRQLAAEALGQVIEALREEIGALDTSREIEPRFLGAMAVGR